MKIAFIGGGNMATAIIGGMLEEGYLPENILVIDINQDQLDKLNQQYGVQTATSIGEQLLDQDMIVLAIKPQQLKEVCHELQKYVSNQLVLSIAAGIRSTDISLWLGGYQAIIRSMPNTPALVQSGMTGLFALPNVTDSQKEQVETIFDAIGEYIWVDEESQLDAITAISGSGPAYVFYFIESLQKAGEKLGFDEDTAKKLAYSTFKGAIKLANQSYEIPAEELRHRVTSKGGTTERAIQTFEKFQLKQQVEEATLQAKIRSEELADLLSKS